MTSRPPCSDVATENPSFGLGMTRPERGKLRILSDGSVPGMILPALARWAAEESHVLADEDSPFHADLVPGDPRVLLIVGENASGKSLAFRLIAQLAGTHGAVPITISIRERTGAGSDGHERMRRVFMFGDEEQSSTGATSAGVVMSGFSNLDRDKPAILGLDEPEIFSHAREGCRLASALN